jgi:hypothetical protein
MRHAQTGRGYPDTADAAIAKRIEMAKRQIDARNEHASVNKRREVLSMQSDWPSFLNMRGHVLDEFKVGGLIEGSTEEVARQVSSDHASMQA